MKGLYWVETRVEGSESIDIRRDDVLPAPRTELRKLLPNVSLLLSFLLARCLTQLDVLSVNYNKLWIIVPSSPTFYSKKRHLV